MSARRLTVPETRDRSIAGMSLIPARARFAQPGRAVLHVVPVLHSDREPTAAALCGARSAGAWVLRPEWPETSCPLCAERQGELS